MLLSNIVNSVFANTFLLSFESFFVISIFPVILSFLTTKLTSELSLSLISNVYKFLFRIYPSGALVSTALYFPGDNFTFAIPSFPVVKVVIFLPSRFWISNTAPSNTLFLLLESTFLIVKLWLDWEFNILPKFTVVPKLFSLTVNLISLLSNVYPLGALVSFK